MNKNRYTLKNYTAATKKLITLLLFVFFCVSCQSTVCIEEMVWQNNNLKSVSLQPKVIRFLEKNYCGFSLDINRKWCTMEMATRFEDSFLKGDRKSVV